MPINTRLLYKLTNILKSFCLCYSLKKVVFSTKDLLCNGTRIVMFLFYYRSFCFISQSLCSFHLFRLVRFQCILVWFQGMNDWIFFATLQRLWIFCSDDIQKFFSLYVCQTYPPIRLLHMPFGWYNMLQLVQACSQTLFQTMASLFITNPFLFI